MANNFKSTEVSLTNASETNIVTATSNNQIMIGLNACNKGTATLTLDVTLRDGSNDFKLAKGVSIPPNSKVEIVRGKICFSNRIFFESSIKCFRWRC